MLPSSIFSSPSRRTTAQRKSRGSSHRPITHSFTELLVDSFYVLYPNRLLALLATYLPNVHTVTVLSSQLCPGFNDSKSTLPRKPVISHGLLMHSLDPLVFLLGHFEHIGTLTLAAEHRSPFESPPFELYFANPRQALPAVKHLDIGDMPVDMALLERMAHQPQFERNLVHLSLTRCVSGCEQLASVARVLHAAKDTGTLQHFHFFPTFRGGTAFRAGVHRAGMELLANELSSCTALREVQLSMLMPVTIGFKIHLDQLVGSGRR